MASPPCNFTYPFPILSGEGWNVAIMARTTVWRPRASRISKLDWEAFSYTHNRMIWDMWLPTFSNCFNPSCWCIELHPLHLSSCSISTVVTLEWKGWLLAIVGYKLLHNVSHFTNKSMIGSYKCKVGNHTWMIRAASSSSPCCSADFAGFDCHRFLILLCCNFSNVFGR